MDMQQQLGS